MERAIGYSPARVIVLTGGELFVVAFIVVAVVSAPWWPKLGEFVLTTLLGKGKPPERPR
jgi:hypothetical protein